MSESGKRLIVNADDYGTSQGVSRGILEAHLKGIVSSTSVMISGDEVETALEEALQTAPTLGLGLHFTLSGDTCKPILPTDQIPSLLRGDGTFYPFAAWLEHYPQFDDDEIRQEMIAQCERFIALTGKPPDHLDAHHHSAYRHPAGLQALFDLAAQYGIPVRNVGFSATDKAHNEAVLDDLLGAIEGEAASVSRTAIRALLEKAHAPWPDRFEAGFYDATATLGDLLLILTTLAANSLTELMCHPGYNDMQLINDYKAKREDELAALTARSAREVLAAEGIGLVTYRALHAQAAP